MAHRLGIVALFLGVAAGPLAARNAPELRGSRESMLRQNEIAIDSRYEFVQNDQQLAQLVTNGDLVQIQASPDIAFKGVSYPYARPVVRDFVENLARTYAALCAEPLLITSLVRPLSRQPRNASPLSVHPAGMAVDLHVPPMPACRIWLEKRLLSLEAAGVVDVTLEHHPQHLHVAVYPEAYAAYAARLPAAAPAESSDGPRADGGANGSDAAPPAARGAPAAGSPRAPRQASENPVSALIAGIADGPRSILWAVAALGGLLVVVYPVRRRRRKRRRR